MKYFIYIKFESHSYQNILKVFKQQFTKLSTKEIYKMSSNTDITTVRSICIPRVFNNIGEARIREIFEKLDIFQIARIDVIQKQGVKGDIFKRVFIHIKAWSDKSDALKAHDRLLAGKDLKIVYDDPWFWKVAVNKWTPKAAPAPPVPKSKIRIEFDIEEDEPTIQSKNAEAAARVLANVPRYEKEGKQRPTQHQRPDDHRQRREDRYRPAQHQEDRYRPAQHHDDHYRREDRYRPAQHHNDRHQRPDNRKPIAPALAYDPVANRDYRDGAYYEQQRQQAVTLEAADPVSLEQEYESEPVIQAAETELAAMTEQEPETEVEVSAEAALEPELAVDPVVLEPVLIKITPENVKQYIGEYITFKNGGVFVVRQILRASETGKTIEIDYPELKNNIQIITRNVFLNNGANIAAEPSKPRYIKVTDKIALNTILANALA